jgi:6-phosphofructokinase 1
MKRIAVLTSGGDAPGMNAAIRAVVRCGIDRGWDVFGVKLGYEGLLHGNMAQLGRRDVGGIMQHGGTMLGSARCLEFKTESGQKEALRMLNQRDIEALVVIGGNGSQTGAYALHKLGFPVVGVASTIDNDLFGSETTIGVDTALNIAIEAMDRLKVTASSHQRAFLLEVMGRNCGYLALMTGIAGGAEAILIPEIETDPEELAQKLVLAYEKGKEHALVVVAEGSKYNAQGLIDYFGVHQERLGFEVRATILGHTQRGGTPSAYDRILATRLGAGAIEFLADGQSGVLSGWNKSSNTATPLEEVVNSKKPIDIKLMELAGVLDK